jgi:hypothetical protein
VIKSDDYFEKPFEEISRCYLSVNLFGYLVSEINRLHHDFIPDYIVDRAKKRMDAQAMPDNPLEIALKVSAFLTFGVDVRELENEIDYILNCKDNNTSDWGAYPFFQHRRLNHVFGSKATTTVFCLEALKRYSDKVEIPSHKTAVYTKMGN